MKYKVPEGAQTVSSALDLEERYGDTIRHLGLEYPTAYKFCRALREMEIPVCISNSTAQVWLQKYARHGEVRSVQNAGHLETLCGDRIRSDGPSDATADALAAWLLKELAVSAPRRVCQTFLTKTWSSSGRIMTIEALEEAAGERLRLHEYSDKFLSDESAGELSVTLAESQPPLHASALILRSWYVKFHPDSGALRYDTVEASEEALGEVLRSKYPGMGYRDLRTSLGKRRKAVLVSGRVCQKWCTKYGQPSASSSSGISSLGQRSAPLQPAEPPVKRRVITKTALSSMYPIELHGPDDVEAFCGDRYRREV